MMADEAAVRGVQDLRLLHATPKSGKRIETIVDLPMIMPRTHVHRMESRLLEERRAEFNPLDAEADRELRAVCLPDLDMGQ